MSSSRSKAVSGLVIVALAAATVAQAAEGNSIRASAQRVDFSRLKPTATATKSAAAESASNASAVPRSLPRASSVHKSTGMIIVSSISVVAGLAGTYYGLKMLKDAQKTGE